jgi:hypothetical protein
MNIPYEAWGNTLRENAERIGEAIIENETVKQLAAKGAALGERITDSDVLRTLAAKGAELGERIKDGDVLRLPTAKNAKQSGKEREPVRLLAAKGAKVARAYRRKKAAALLAAGFAGGVAVTLLAVKAVDHLKRVRKKAQELERIREEQKDYADVGEPTEE